MLKQTIIILILAAVLTFIASCRNIQEWKKTTTTNHLTAITTVEIMYKSDTGFDLGTEGLGEYNLFKVTGTELLGK